MYELVCRHFLACVSDNAMGKETTVNVDINGEKVTFFIIEVLFNLITVPLTNCTSPAF